MIYTSQISSVQFRMLLTGTLQLYTPIDRTTEIALRIGLHTADNTYVNDMFVIFLFRCSFSIAAEQIYSPCKLGRLRARYNHASKNVYASATNFTSDWRKLFNPRCHATSTRSVQELSKDGEYVRSCESGRRCNRSLPKSPLLLVTREFVRHGRRKRPEDTKRDEKLRRRKRNTERSLGTARGEIFSYTSRVICTEEIPSLSVIEIIICDVLGNFVTVNHFFFF
ncbi:hypothetical protein PUN28_002540 [Cardiocondyla obscurior]|uniref:Uncharacterized protein n=1 Tax=Cardiocondyla obscurior TaxID=286306 RepID=A0AAW2GUN6_9HYME